MLQQNIDDDIKNLGQLKLLNHRSQSTVIGNTMILNHKQSQLDESKHESYIVPDKDDKSKQKKQQEEQNKVNLSLKKSRQQFSKKEIFTLCAFTAIMIYIMSAQLKIDESYKLNQFQEYYFAKNFTTGDTLLKSDIDVYLSNQLLKAFYTTEYYNEYLLQSEMRHISYLRLTQQRVKITNQTLGNNNTFNIWDNPITPDYSTYGPSNIFQYDSYNNGFVQFFSAFNLTHAQAVDMLTNLSNDQFFDEQTNYISCDGVFYNSNYDMVAVFQIEFSLTSAGAVYVTVLTEAYRVDPYSSTQDKVRFAFEIIFLVLFIFYFIDEFIKIYRQISKVQKEYNEKEKYKEELKERAKGLDKHEDKNQPFSFDKALETIKQFSRLINILKGLGNHVQDVWSFLDVALLTFIAIAMSYWIRFATNSQLTDIMNQIPPTTSTLERQAYDYSKVNIIALKLADYLVQYRIFACLAVFIAAFKTSKYIISLSARLSDYLAIMMRMLDFMLFYIILLTSIIFAFAYMGIFIYGANISLYSTLYKAIVQTIILMVSGSSVSQEMISYTLIGTFFYFLVFYFLTISILVNMFWVFVKNEYLNFEKEKQELEDQLYIKQDQHEEIEPHIYYYFKNQIYEIWMRIKYSTNKEKYQEYLQDQIINEKRVQREFEYSQGNVKFDIDFADVLEQGQTKSLAFQVEEEREKHIQNLKMETIRIIWQTVFLLILLVINIEILFLFDNPINSHNQYLNQYTNIVNSNVTIIHTDFVDYTNYLDIKQKDQVFGWLSTSLDNQFSAINMTKNISFLFPSGRPQELGSQDLYGYYIDFYNLLMFNKIRLTLKYTSLSSSTSFTNIEPQFIQSLKGYADDTDLVLESDTPVPSGVDYSTDPNNGIKYTRGYTFGVQPSRFEDLMGILKREGNLRRELSSICIDYALFNPQGQYKGLTYNKLIYEFDYNGLLKTNDVQSESIVILNLNQPQSVILLILIILLAFYLLYNLYQLIQNLRGKYKSYQRWYELYILNYLSPGQLYYRERQKPEIIRKIQYIFNVPIILRFVYTILISLIVIAFLYIIFQSLYLVNRGQVFNISTQHFLSFHLNEQYDTGFTFFQYINKHADLIQTFIIVKHISVISVFILCIQILYNLTTNQAFQDILKAIKYVVSQLPFLILLLWMLLTTFCLLTYFKLGSYNANFSNFGDAYISLCQCFYSLKDLLDIFQQDGSWFEVFIFLIPYIIVVRFLMLNLFSAVVYKGYETIFVQRKQREKEDVNQIDPLAIGLKEFFVMSWKFFKEKKQEEFAKNNEFINQIVKKSSTFEIFDQVKTTVRQYKPQMDAQVWADRCASDLKKENDVRSALKQVCDELSLTYMKSINQGNFSFINELNKDKNRKLAEFKLRLKYYTYFKLGYCQYKQIQWQFEHQLQFFKTKFSTNFNQQTQQEMQEYYLKLYICQLEEKMKQRSYIIQQIKQDIQLVTNYVQKRNVNDFSDI
ncbi:polycystin cation channel protein (macronuclear) [Tetrahymena thermophila SB210]|uniref:Polycystin cation channel protein n=1 Tax=Tetrahymena thermophila (strain SB210) TaxID=312017 RepID=I7MH64_TETTS|nr:polycystin cation channel protein [Tetrahymena thermophila SB210]EAS02660.2 polycystin cation channel protein [Tetrahymena thermophila SB210]|eukprot:XP_001022905.2 polycystin cation channel protein [Tetrahymena thermophila SB210]